MSPAYQNDEQGGSGESDELRVAIRRHTDRCYHRVEEVVPGQGYIVDGVLIDQDDVAQVVELDGEGQPLPPCDPPTSGA